MALPNLTDGSFAVDDRGIVSFLNSVPFENVKRIYTVENFSTDTIRAFHGHKIEEKFILATAGAAVVVLAKISTGGALEDKTKYVLSSRTPRLLYIPAGYANGFRALEANTKLIIFSTTTIDQAKTDDYRFPYDYFGKEIWQVESR